MTNPAVLVTGATGLLGRQVLKAFQRPPHKWDAKGLGHSRADGKTVLKVDLQNEAELKETLEGVKPQVVVHCAASRFPDKVDKDPEGARALNVAATAALASLCAAQGALLIYISTDYVFAGRPGEAPYAADAPPAPPNLYGQTKLGGEHAVLDEYQCAGKAGLGVVLRVPVLYGAAERAGESAVNVLMEALWKAQGEKVVMDHWSIRYPTNTEDVARVCRDVAEHYLAAADRAALPTVLQFSSEDRYTKYDMCKVFGEIMGLPLDKMEANTQGNDPAASVQRPYDCHLSTAALKDLGINVSTQDFVAWWRREARAYRK